MTNPDASVIFYRWDGTPALIYATPFNLTNIPNQPPETAGTLDLTWWSNTTCSLENQQTATFYIDLTNPILESKIPVNNSIVTCNSMPEISAVISEVYGSNSGLDENSVSMKVDSIDVTGLIDLDDLTAIKTRISYQPTTPLVTGVHNVEISGMDNSGRAFSELWSFTINQSATFTMNVSLPINKTYNEKRIAFDLLLNEQVALLEYSDILDDGEWKRLCTNCNDYTREVYFGQGYHDIIIRATDSCGNSKTEQVKFLVDSIKPKLYSTLPRKNAVINGSEFFVRYNEDNCKNITLTYGNFVSGYQTKPLLNCSGGRKQNWTISVDLTIYDGELMQYWFNLSDVASTVGSRITEVTADTTSPILTVNSPLNVTYGRNVRFDLNVTEKTRIQYLDLSLLDSRWRSLQSNNDIYNRTKSFSRGNHNILIRAVDKAGNSDTEQVNFEVDY